MDPSVIRGALADVARTVCDNSYPFRPDSVNDLPAVWVDMPELRKISHGSATWDIAIDIVVAVSDVWDEDAQTVTDGIAVDLWAAIDAARTLGGVVNGSAIATEFLPVKATDNRAWVGGVMTVRIQHTDT